MHINMFFVDDSNPGKSELLQVSDLSAVGKFCSEMEHDNLFDKDIPANMSAEYLYEVSKAFFKAEHSRKTKEGIRKSKEHKAKELPKQAKRE